MLMALLLLSTITRADPHRPVHHDRAAGTVTLTTEDGGLVVQLDHRAGAVVRRIRVGGAEVGDGASTTTGIRMGSRVYSSARCERPPRVTVSDTTVIMDSIRFGGEELPVQERWTFSVLGKEISWEIERHYGRSGWLDDCSFPRWEFASMQTWDGALLDNGGAAWNRFLANPGESYGTHAGGLVFWNRMNNTCLKVDVDDDPRVHRVVTFSHADDGRYAITQSTSSAPVPTVHGLYRFRGKGERIFGPFTVERSVTRARYRLSVASYDRGYDRGELKGIDEGSVNEMLNTIGRYGVVDRGLYGSNGWRTGWTVLQEPWLALFGLAINAPEYVSGLTGALEHAAEHAVLPDGRVLPRWHHDSTDAMPGTFRANGFYECVWGFMLDTQPAFAINVAEQFDLTGDTTWLRRMKPVCEKALGYMIRRDSDRDGLFEVIQRSWREGKGTDWFDVVWASWEVSSVNAYMYMALDRWSGLERVMGDTVMAAHYGSLASALKTAFNRTVADGGFWHPDSQCYVHWVEPDGIAYGANLNTMVNFLAIGYGLCDDDGRRKAVLARIEELMQQEGLFIWPSCFFPYEEGVGLADVNYPWPNYENGDLFLAWAELGTRCYAKEDPGIALRYIRNVIRRYERDGLAHQRYTRVAQTGAGDDILSNNIMAVVGLWRNLYGIRPQYNRLLIDPHLPSELEGTRVKYHLRGRDYHIEPGRERSTIRVDGWSLTAPGSFAVNPAGTVLEYFHGDDPHCSLRFTTGRPCVVDVTEWGAKRMGWTVTGAQEVVTMSVFGREPGAVYEVVAGGAAARRVVADRNGIAMFECPPGSLVVQVFKMRD